MGESPIFSQRHGYTPAEPEITIRQEAPHWFRSLVLSNVYEPGLGPHRVRDILRDLLLEKPDATNWSEGNVASEADHLLSRADWLQVYDFIEITYRALQNPQGIYGFGLNSDKLEKLTPQSNDAFRRKGVGWQLMDGTMEIRGPEVFEQSVREAQATLAQTGRQVAHNEIHQALMDLSKRPAQDATGTIPHAMAALDCVARDVAGDPKSPLGDLLKKHPGTLPPPLDMALSKIWGFASDQGRHLRESQAPDIKETQLIVGLAGSLATYLVKKFRPRTS